MGETKKIVTEHYPAEKLPDELRRGIATGATVRVTVEPEREGAKLRSLKPFLGAGKGVYSEEEAVSFIRRLREE